MNEKSLNIPIYLNQKVVFDLVATVENGITHVTKVTSSGEKTTELSGGLDSELGNKNIFAFLGISFSGSKNTSETEHRELEKIHTPSSLFSSLREKMVDNDLVKLLCSEEDYRSLQEGDFVEFEGVITPNPIIEALQNLSQMIELASVFDSGDKKQNKNKKNREMSNQIKMLMNSMQTSDVVDWICSSQTDFPFKTIMPMYNGFFFNNNTHEIVDGKFKVLAKVSKICSEGEEINLLRNTSFTLLRKNALESIFKVMEIEDENFEIKGMDTYIPYPALIAIPIAIFL